MVMPTKYRQKLQEDCDSHLVLTADLDGCLLLYPLPEWERIEAALANLSAFDPKQRRIQRLMMGYATEVDMDGNGRLLLPPPLREFSGLTKRIVLVGQANKFELWDEETWNAERDDWLAEENDGELPDALRDLRL
jgi:MraZ protein